MPGYSEIEATEAEPVQNESPVEPEAEEEAQEDRFADEKERSKFIDELGLITQDANINFLVGAGASQPGFVANSNIEDWLNTLDDDNSPKGIRARASIYAHFLTGVGEPSSQLVKGEESEKLTDTLNSYQTWLGSLHRLLLRRRDSIRSKRASIFTSNVDLAIEVAAELVEVEISDGFAGRFAPKFSTRNFGSVRSVRSWQYEHMSEVPTFDLLKVHGSFDWMPDGAGIRMDARLSLLAAAIKSAKGVVGKVLLIEDKSDLSKDLLGGEDPSAEDLEAFKAFLAAYEELRIVNPTRAKFETTLMDHTHYDLLRLFSNELEKENSVLFVLGFSCRDDHISKLIKRAAESNPTLQVFVFAYQSSELSDIAKQIQDDANRNENIEVVSPFPPEAEKKWIGNWTLTEFSERVLDAIVPRVKDEKVKLVAISELKEKTRAGGE